MDLLLQRATRTRVAVLPPHFQKSDLGLDEAYYSMMCPFDSGVRKQYFLVYVERIAALLVFRTLHLSNNTRFRPPLTSSRSLTGDHGLDSQTDYERM